MTTAASLYLANIPSPDRGVWNIDLGALTIPIRAYALCIIAGIILAIWWGERRLIARGGRQGDVLDIAVFAVPFGLVGGRLYHVATDYYRYFGAGKNPLNALKVWDGGLGIWGAIALGAVGAYIGCKRKGIPLPVFADAVAPGVVAAQAVGRIGNYFNQELYGGSTNLPWGLEIYVRQPDNLTGVAVPGHPQIDGSPFHPTFLYELIWNLLVAALVVYLDRRLRLGHGRACAVYVAGYTLGRGWIEMMRTDPATMVFGVRINVWVSLLVFLGAITYFVLARAKGEREDLVALRAAFEGETPPASTEDTEGAAETKDSADTEGAGDTDDTDDTAVAKDEDVKADEPETEAAEAKAEPGAEEAKPEATPEPEATTEATTEAKDAGTPAEAEEEAKSGK
ncbi:prolipoprotein diacylglyceryl transferase [Labedaea rhizosphaerae]|uniref:Phosphatidylglycerol--prolipoprotein diacylglyceryl transferase n=1 Tax=Labedaea rhizosphaerae TaxID=598644 RepID=A0A4V6PVT6_LABRH|nr:prolipoprotein diacylglyceryl transferase [Labedaea rhizosphaerae]